MMVASLSHQLIQKEKEMILLKEWVMRPNCFMGLVYNHKHLPDGEFIQTSKPVRVTVQTGVKGANKIVVLETLNTVYRLGLAYPFYRDNTSDENINSVLKKMNVQVVQEEITLSQ